MTTSTFNGYDALLAFSQSNIDALIQTNQVFAKAVQEIAALTQAELERAATAGREALAARSFEEVFKVQTGFATASLEQLLATSTKLGELNARLATDAVAPVVTKLGAVPKVTARAA